MKTLKIATVSFILSLLFTTTHAQITIKTVDNICKKDQDALDTGDDMLGTARKHYLRMDSVLNVAYNQLRKTLNPTEKEALKKEQLGWLKKRDTYFKKQENIFQHNIKTGEWGSDMYMVTYEEDADFVEARVRELIKRFKG
ncbi:MAG: DUF1311 domain-containing protein [Sphingobacteriales bacterium]|nr:DUF1311 domain-containing protein [Sphingobacteriales bacterium]